MWTQFKLPFDDINIYGAYMFDGSEYKTKLITKVNPIDLNSYRNQVSDYFDEVIKPTLSKPMLRQYTDYNVGELVEVMDCCNHSFKINSNTVITFKDEFGYTISDFKISEKVSEHQIRPIKI